jgi:hypothetical protein
MTARNRSREIEFLNNTDSKAFLDDLKSAGFPTEAIHVSEIDPDTAQARSVLPRTIYEPIRASSPTNRDRIFREVVENYTKIVKPQARRNGREWDRLSDVHENDFASSIPLSPDEKALYSIVNLALSIHTNGQINPITVYKIDNRYGIETGERRWFAIKLLHLGMLNRDHDGNILCFVIPQDKFSPLRQAEENSKRADLKAVEVSRQILKLILFAHGIFAPEGSVPYEWYRQGLDMDLKGGHIPAKDIYDALGFNDRFVFSRYKNLYRLCDEALNLADRYDVSEGRLRPLLKLSPQDQVEMLQQFAGLNDSQTKPIEEISGDSDEKANKRSLTALQRVTKIDTKKAATLIKEDFVSLKEWEAFDRQFSDWYQQLRSAVLENFESN